MPISTEAIQTHIPFYLTQDQKDGLIKALGDFPRQIQYYIGLYSNEMLQGDGWEQLEVIRFEDGARGRIKGIAVRRSEKVQLQKEMQ